MKNTKDATPHSIYVIIDPRDNERRYVGQTTKSLERRLAEHLRTKETNHRGHLMRSFVRDGVMPIIQEIEVVPAGEDWASREMFWIAVYRGWGCDLVNATDGGEGTTGYIYTEGHRKKISDSNLGRKMMPASVEKSRRAKMIPIAQYTLEGKFIKKWDCVASASRELVISTSNINACVRHRIKSAGDYQWRYWSETLGADIEPIYRKSRAMPVAQCTHDGEFIKEWESATQAGRALGICHVSISLRAREGNGTAGGFQWHYIKHHKK